MATQRGVFEVAVRGVSLLAALSCSWRLLGWVAELAWFWVHYPGPEWTSQHARFGGADLAAIGVGLAPLAILALSGLKSAAVARWIVPEDADLPGAPGPAGCRGLLQASLRVLGLLGLYSAGIWFARTVLEMGPLRLASFANLPVLAWAGEAAAALLALSLVHGGNLVLRIAAPEGPNPGEVPR